jgi:hypothetical protein
MADNLKGFDEETLRRASNIGDAIKEIKQQTRDLNKELKGASAPLSDIESYYNNISGLSRKLLDIQDKSLYSSKGTGEALKKQNEARNQARALDIKINELLNQKVSGNAKINSLIDKQVRNISEAKDQAKMLAEEYGKIAISSANLDTKTKFFSKAAEFVKDVRGLRTFAGPFEAAAKAAREQVMQNEKALFLEQKIEEHKKATTKEEKARIGREIKEFKDKEGKSSKEILAGKGKAGAAGMSAFTKDIGSSLSGFLKGPIWITALIEAAKFIMEAMFAASKQIADFQRNLGVSKDNAVEIRDRFFEISDSAKALANTQTGNLILQKDLVEAQESFNNALGLAVDLSTKQNEEFAAQFTNVKKFYNLNEQEQKGLINLNVINGKTVNETKNSILKQTALYKINTKEAINVKKVLKDVLTTSNSIKLSIRGGGEALTQAVINTQRLGISLNDVDKISDSLLNFEQSISSELEAELLTGRDLNLEKARAAALSNDQVTLTEEINRLVKDAGPDFEKNKIAMQASAAAIGIGVDQLADMVTQQKAVEKFKQNFNALDNQAIKNSKKLTDKEKQRLLDGTASTAEYYKFAKEQGKDLNSILGDEMATRLEAQDAQQKFNDALEKAKETFSRFVDGEYLDKFADFITRFVESVGIKGLGNTLAFGLASDLDIKTAKFEKNTKALESETDPEKKEQLQAELNNQKTELRHDSLVSSGLSSSQADELLSAPGWSDIFSSIKDAITSNKSDEMISLMKQQNQHLENIVNKEGTIVLDGTKMGTAMAVGSYKTQ